MKSNWGFTLMEVMMVVAIISAVVISVPAFHEWVQRQGVGLAVDQLRADLQLARITAINRKKNCAIVFNSPGPNQYTNSLNHQTVDLAGYRGGVRFLPIGPAGGGAKSQIIFNRQGMSTSASEVDVFLTDQAKHAIYRLRVLGPGGISVARWTGGRWY
jgi:prepilin-type N-terminal cleavage/methylation domain-containing protein